MWRDPKTGVLYGVGSTRPNLSAARSEDNGLTWKTTKLILAPQANGWDARGVYRPTIQPHPNGTHFRV